MSIELANFQKMMKSVKMEEIHKEIGEIYLDQFGGGRHDGDAFRSKREILSLIQHI